MLTERPLMSLVPVEKSPCASAFNSGWWSEHPHPGKTEEPAPRVLSVTSNRWNLRARLTEHRTRCE